MGVPVKSHLVFVGVVIAAAACGPDQRRTVAGDDATPDPDLGLRLEARPLREQVTPDGPVRVRITIRNESDGPMTFKPMLEFGEWLDAEILDKKGVRLQMSADIDGPNALAITLQGGESITDTIDLRCGSDGPERTRNCIMPYEGLARPGTYTVRMRFTLPCNPCSVLNTIEAEPFVVRVLRGD